MTNSKNQNLRTLVNRINAYVATLTPQQKYDQFGDVHTDLIAATEIMSAKKMGTPTRPTADYGTGVQRHRLYKHGSREFSFRQE